MAGGGSITGETWGDVLLIAALAAATGGIAAAAAPAAAGAAGAGAAGGAGAGLATGAELGALEAGAGIGAMELGGGAGGAGDLSALAIPMFGEAGAPIALNPTFSLGATEPLAGAGTTTPLGSTFGEQLANTANVVPSTTSKPWYSLSNLADKDTLQRGVLLSMLGQTAGSIFTPESDVAAPAAAAPVVSRGGGSFTPSALSQLQDLAAERRTRPRSKIF